MKLKILVSITLGSIMVDVLEAVSSSVLVIETFPKWTKSGFNRERSFAKMFLMEF